MSAAYEAAFGLALGFSLTVPPGPMNALIASRAARSFRKGFLTGLGAMSADLILATVVYLLQSEIDLAGVARYLYAVGAVVMAFLAYRVLSHRSTAERVDSGGLATYTSALAIGLSNPFQSLWWLTAGLAFAYLGGIVLLVGLFAAVAIWILVFPYAVHAGLRRYPGAERALTWISGLIIVVFAIYFAVLAI